jgi:pyruvate,water dikinase
MAVSAEIEPRGVVEAGDRDFAREERVGGKGAGLARLFASGATVPPWFVVPTEAFREHVARGGAGGGAIETTPMDDAVARAVDAALARLGAGPYAVRSSMVGEDSATKSFAGQFDTLLFQRDATEVKEAIKKCWASAYSERSIAYRKRAGIDVDAGAMAVVVQRMIDGRVSGVVFTANPTNGRRDEALVTACWGLGEGIVGGACNTDEFVVAHDGVERSAKVVDKDVQVVSDGRGTRESSVPAAQRDARSLTIDEARRVALEATRVAKALGSPQDIEWTIAGSDLFLLQARPITTLPAEAVPPVRAPSDPRLLWDNSNIQESYCGVTTPLTFSFALAGYATVYEVSFRLLGVPEPIIEEHRPVFANMLGLVRGRVYYNLNNWYRVLALLPSFGRNKTDMEKMMGVTEPVDFVVDDHLSAIEKARRAPGMMRTGAIMMRELSRLDKSVDEFQRRIEAEFARYDRASFKTQSFSELMAMIDQLWTDIVERWQTPIVNDIFVMMASGKLRRMLEKMAPEQAASLWNTLVAGEEGIESTEPTRKLLRMAKVARATPAIASALRSLAPAEAMAKIRAEHPTFAADLDAYLDRYGDRTMGELKLETISLRDDPSFLAKVLVNYLDRPDIDPDKLAEGERAAREDALRSLEARIGPLERQRLRKALANARRGVKARENMRLARTRGFGLIRDIYVAIGGILHAAGKLDHPRDVFYLTVGEIRAYHGGTAVTADLAPLARLRKAEYARYEAEELPNRFETVGAVYHGNDLSPARVVDPDASVLCGLASSPGVVEGALRVVTNPHDDLSVNGHILTALRTDPGWAPLFPTASGILVERGSTLSHSAVLARELGIPAVVGVPNLLKIVKDGERVRLDGSAGTVERQR